MNIIFNCVCLLALGFAGSAIAQPIAIHQADQIDLLNYTPPMVYQDQMVISVRTTSQAQLDAMLMLTESVWTEHTGIGQLDIQIKQSSLDTITALGIPHDVLIKDLQAHTTANWNRIVEIERQEQEAQVINQGQRGAGVHDDTWFSNYKQLNEITDYINNIVALHPDLAQSQVIGQSWEGRDMFSITISGPDSPENPRADRPAVFIFSTVHAREWIAPMTTTYYASKFVEDYATDPRVQAILDSTRIVIVPVGNPDGYVFTWTEERYWRKTRRANFNGTFGVDINRNWGYEWGGQGASNNPGNDTYHGTVPFSEPETANLRDTALGFGDQLIAHMEYHSYSQLVLWPFGYADGVVTPEPDRTFFDQLSQELAVEIESVHGSSYIAEQSVDLYAHSGNSPDWFFGELDIPSMLIELRPANSDFNPDPINILPNAQENYHAFKRYVERVVEPASIWHEEPRNPYTNTLDVHADTPTPITATIMEGFADQPISSPTLFVRIGNTGPFEPIEMIPDGVADFNADLPPAPCGQLINYYFQATLADGSLHTFYSDAAMTPWSILAQEFVVVHTDDFESDTGWVVGSETDTATSGIWTRMDPEGTIAQPENDHTPDGSICWVTDGLAGDHPDDNDVDGITTLTSPTFNAIGNGGEPYLNFWAWFSTTRPAYTDVMGIELSNDDGNTWESAGYFIGRDEGWFNVKFPFSLVIEPTDQMRVRFRVEDIYEDDTVEAAIDDFKIEFFGCPTTNPADLNNDGILDFFDVSIFLSAFNDQNPIADFTNDGIWDFFDVSAFLSAFSNG